uniref:Uncharacterized protein n=2 Tax=Enterobacteriaceae TaxID=543 RepID=A0A7D3P3K8_ECOLX|nr:hypothetical protein EFNPAABL_00111 [Klebsiella pneumoniae]QJR99276.1 hypothetical protein DELFAIOC_00110 [Escherichia coli]
MVSNTCQETSWERTNMLYRTMVSGLYVERVMNG